MNYRKYLLGFLAVLLIGIAGFGLAVATGTIKLGNDQPDTGTEEPPLPPDESVADTGFCGDGTSQAPNADGVYEMCDGQDYCTNNCTIRTARADGVCRIGVLAHHLDVLRNDGVSVLGYNDIAPYVRPGTEIRLIPPDGYTNQFAPYSSTNNAAYADLDMLFIGESNETNRTQDGQFTGQIQPYRFVTIPQTTINLVKSNFNQGLHIVAAGDHGWYENGAWFGDVANVTAIQFTNALNVGIEYRRDPRLYVGRRTDRYIGDLSGDTAAFLSGAPVFTNELVFGTLPNGSNSNDNYTPGYVTVTDPSICKYYDPMYLNAPPDSGGTSAGTSTCMISYVPPTVNASDSSIASGYFLLDAGSGTTLKSRMTQILSSVDDCNPLILDPLEIQKTNSVVSTDVNEAIVEYTITVTNPNSLEVSGTVSDVPQTGVQVITDSISNEGTLNGSQIVWADVSVPGNGSLTFTYRATLPSSLFGQQVVNTATFTPDVGTPVTDDSTVEVNVVPPSIDKSAEIDSIDSTSAFVNYTLTVRNDFDSGFDNVDIVDDLPEGVIGVTNISNGGVWDSAGNVINWNDLTLQAGPNYTLTLTYTVEFSNSVFGDDLQNETILSVEDQEVDRDDETVVVDPNLEAQIIKTNSQVTGDNFTVVDYSLRVENLGDVALVNYSVEDTYDSGVQASWISAISNDSSGTPGTISGGKITWSDIDLAVGADIVLTYRVTFPDGTEGEFENVAIVKDGDGNEVDRDDNTVVIVDIPEPIVPVDVPPIPVTAIEFDAKWLIILGTLLVAAGFVTYRMALGSRLNWDKKIDNLIAPFETKVHRDTTSKQDKEADDWID